MADSTTNISLIRPILGENALIREYFNSNVDIIDGRFSSTYLAVQNKSAVSITGGSIVGITDLVVSDGGTGVSTLTNGGVLLGSGTEPITAMAVLADSEMIVGNGTTDPVAESGATLRTSIGCAATAQTFYIGTTQVAINRASAALTLAGITLTTPDIGTPSAGTLTNCGGTASSLTAGAVTNATFTTALAVNTGTLTLTAHSNNDSVLTIGTGASSISGSNTGDQTNISGNAATVTVDATTSDTTCFVAIFESASGSLEPQTDATLTYNADTGVLTSTFAGALTGNVTGNCSGTAATVTGATQASITTCANLATVGTIGTGVWEGTDIGVAHGGTAKSSWTLYCIPYLSGTTAFGEITIGTVGQVLKVSAGETGYEFAAESGGVDTSGTPADDDYAKFTDADTIEGRSYAEVKTDLDLIKCKNNATEAPGVGDDSADGYAVNSIWGDVTNDKSYICLDAAEGAAVWREISLPTSLTAITSIASVSNADITIQPNGTGDTIIYAPSDVVTTKTSVATLTIAEAGTVLVSCAATPYTITLPTASGHSGLRYHFVKTDANYFLITLDGNGGETFNYENTTSAPIATYARLNTYCAEVTIVSDGTNWQVTNEVLGQTPYCWAYLSAEQLNIPNDTAIRAELDTEEADIGSNFDVSEWVSGTADENTNSHLVDDGESQFTSAMVGVRVQNTNSSAYAYVLSIVDAGDLELNLDIFPLGNEPYQIMNAKFVAPVDGKYMIVGSCMAVHGVLVADKRWYARSHVNSSLDVFAIKHSSSAEAITESVNYKKQLSKDDYVELFSRHSMGVDTIDLGGSEKHETNLVIWLSEKD